jgi:hypothetical protein
MYELFNQQFPRMRPLTKEVYGKLIFLAGVENEALREQVYQAGNRDILVSYFYLRNRKLSTIREELKRFDNVILDSGGFTFLQRAKKGETISNEEIQYYTEQYMRFCDDMADCFNFVFEMDMAWQISEDYRNAHIEELTDRGIRVVPIVHKAYTERLEELGYFDHQVVALAGDLTGGVSGTKMQVIRQFQEKGILVHGLAATDEASINRVPFFSVDSSSWLAGGKYGLTYIWSGTKITVYEADKKEVRLNYLDKFKKAGLDVEGIQNDTAPAINTMNAWAWKQYTDYVRFNITQSYWLTDKEKADGKDFLIKEVQADAVPDAAERYEQESRSADLIRSTNVRDHLPANTSNFLDPRMAVPLNCNNCSLFQQCPAYKRDSTCYYHSTVNVSSLEDTIGVMGALITGQYSRISHAMLAERLNGGNLDPNISKEMTVQMKLAQVMGNLYKISHAKNNGVDVLPNVPGPTIPTDGEVRERTIEAIFSEVSETRENPEPKQQPTVSVKKEPVIILDPPEREIPVSGTPFAASQPSLKSKIISAYEEGSKNAPQAKVEKKTFDTGFSENPSSWSNELFG